MIPALLALRLACAPLSAADAPDDRAARSVVRIFTTFRRPDYYQPWQMAAEDQLSGSGCLIAGGRILTNYFLLIFWLRSWSVGWALTDRITGVVAGAMWAEVATFAENVAHLFGGLTVITSLLYIVSPLLLYGVIGGGAAALTSLLGFSGIGLPFLMHLGRSAAHAVT